MKKTLLFIAVLLSVHLMAQDNTKPAQPDREKIAQTIEALKTAYITKELSLSAEEAQKFWPVYNGYATEIKKARLDLKDDDIGFGEKRIEIMKRYKENFKKVLANDDRVKRCFRAEPEFHKVLRNEWQRRQGMVRPHNGGGQIGGGVRPQQGEGSVRSNDGRLPVSPQHGNGGIRLPNSNRKKP